MRFISLKNKGFTFEERKTRRGFTLIELLVVISIIGMLTALILVNFSNARERARDVMRKSDLNQIKRALRMYYNDFNKYPTDDTSGNIVGCGADGATACTWNGTTSWSAGSAGMIYMKIFAQDPLYDASGPKYEYSQQSSGQDFRLWGPLENKSDGSITTSQSRCSGTWAEDDYVVCAD